MKTIALIIALICCSINLYAQNIEKINVFNDSKNNKISIILTKNDVDGIKIRPSITSNGINLIILVYHGDIICVEEGIMIVEFTDGLRFQMNSYNHFNCDRTFYFSLKGWERDLSIKPIKKITIKNGTGDSENGTLLQSFVETQYISNQDYFIELFKEYNKIDWSSN